MPNPVKSLIYIYILNATARVATDLLKALAIPSDTAVARSAVDREDLKPYWKSEKKVTFLVSNPIIYKFFKDLGQ